MIYNFDELPDRRATESIKWHYYDPDVLPMWVADMDFVSPEPVIRALHERVAHGVFGYVMCLPGLRESVAEHLERRHGWKVSPGEIVLVPGVVTGINQAAQAVIRPGDGVLIQTPVYMPFFGVACNAGGVCQEMELTRHPDGFYTVDYDRFEKSITPETRMFLMCSPHNPVGRIFTRAELERMAEICLRHDMLICSDEIHCDLNFSGHEHIPIASLDPEIARKTITLIAPSKTYNIAGLQCSFAVIQNPELRRAFDAGSLGMAHGVNLLGQVAAKAAYDEGQEWLDQVLVYLEGNRDVLVDFVAHEMPGVRVWRPEGTYLAWLDCRELGLEPTAGAFFLEKARVALNAGEAFGKGGEGFVRLNFGCPRAMLLEALERMKRALGQRAFEKQALEAR